MTLTDLGPGLAGTHNFLLTITALDICGQPILGEPIQVNVFANPGAVVLSPLGIGTSTGPTSATVFVSPDTGQTTLSLEVLSAAVGNAGVLVKVVFPIEHIERFVTVIPPVTPTPQAVVIYPPGWNMIGGPAGSNFSAAERVMAWDRATQSYIDITSGAANISSDNPTCTGYWAYFAASMSIQLPATSRPGDTRTCSLSDGWNDVGNPFASAALISPSTEVAYHWNGTSYDVVSVIPTGGSVWIFSTGASTVTLTAQ